MNGYFHGGVVWNEIGCVCYVENILVQICTIKPVVPSKIQQYCLQAHQYSNHPYVPCI